MFSFLPVVYLPLPVTQLPDQNSLQNNLKTPPTALWCAVVERKQRTVECRMWPCGLWLSGHPSEIRCSAGQTTSMGRGPESSWRVVHLQHCVGWLHISSICNLLVFLPHQNFSQVWQSLLKENSLAVQLLLAVNSCSYCKSALTLAFVLGWVVMTSSASRVARILVSDACLHSVSEL